jgi:hypothetical protein
VFGKRRPVVERKMRVLGGASSNDDSFDSTLENKLNDSFKGIQVYTAAIVDRCNKCGENAGYRVGHDFDLSVGSIYHSEALASIKVKPGF